jgi:hypothetical protein
MPKARWDTSSAPSGPLPLLARELDPHDEGASFAKLAPQRCECRARSRRKSIMKALAARVIRAG